MTLRDSPFSSDYRPRLFQSGRRIQWGPVLNGLQPGQDIDAFFALNLGIHDMLLHFQNMYVVSRIPMFFDDASCNLSYVGRVFDQIELLRKSIAKRCFPG